MSNRVGKQRHRGVAVRRYSTAILCGVISGLLCMPLPASAATISSPLGSQLPIVINTCAHDAGAICSLKWGGKEFVNDYDHGRQLQSAASFDSMGEYFNPTEAGASSVTNGINPAPSSSKLLGEIACGNQLVTQANMAFWNPVGGKKLSGHIHQKQVTIGAEGLPNVIEYLSEFTIPAGETHSFATFEVLTGYMPPEFSRFWAFDVKGTAKLYLLSDGPGEQGLPIIFATPDSKYAMGIYSPDTPQPAYPTAGYGRWRHPDTVKWNHVNRISNPAGTYRFRSYVIVGTLQQVATNMQRLHARLMAK